MRFPHLAHRSAAAHKLHSATATTRYELDSGKGERISRLPALAYSPRKLSKRPGPSHKTNPLGVKGAGEAGNVGALAAIMNAVVDALSPLGIAHIDMPATPEKVWRAISAARRA